MGAKRIPLYSVSLGPPAAVDSIHTFPGVLDVFRLEKSIQTLSATIPNYAAGFVCVPPKLKGNASG